MVSAATSWRCAWRAVRGRVGPRSCGDGTTALGASDAPREEDGCPCGPDDGAGSSVQETSTTQATTTAAAVASRRITTPASVGGGAALAAPPLSGWSRS